MKNLYLLSLLIILFISGCAGISHGPVKGTGIGKGRFIA